MISRQKLYTMKKKVRILIYGAGVIGSIYAVAFSQANYDVSIYARSKRLLTLEQKGLLYEKNDKINKANVSIINNLPDDEIFDFILVTVRYEQISEALNDLATNKSQCIVPMVNTPYGYAQWEKILGNKHLIPCFAGAGGTIENDILRFRFTPTIIQSTIFGEIHGKKHRKRILWQKSLKQAK